MYINQFMWGYQPHFRGSVETSIRTAFTEVGFTGQAEVLLVGFQIQGEHEFPICIEPEDGPYDPSILTRALIRGQELYEENPERHVIHSDPRAHERFHGRLQNEMRSRAVEEALSHSESGTRRAFFAGSPVRVNDYEVQVVISIDQESLLEVPTLHKTMVDRFPVTTSLVHAVILDVIRKSTHALYFPEPGRDLISIDASADEILRSAGGIFVHSILMRAGCWLSSRASAALSAISALPYEGRSGDGKLVIADIEHESINALVRLKNPVSLHDTRAARKLLEASGTAGDLLSTGEEIVGIGKIRDNYDVESESLFTVTISGHGAWELSHGDQPLLSVQDGAVRLPSPSLDRPYFLDLIERVLPNTDPDRLTTLAQAATEHTHGAMLIISSAAESEAQRLSQQAWSIMPEILQPPLLRQLTSMDGGVLVDEQGLCHAAGVILDGPACEGENPARGSRFNSAVRYLQSGAPPAVVVVYSSDGSIDILPWLRPRIRRSVVEEAVESYLRMATPGVRHSGRVDAWERVTSLQFYLSEEQCRVLNDARQALDRWNKEHGRIWVVESPLTPNPEMNDTYWIPED